MKVRAEGLWAGTEEAYAEHMRLEAMVAERMQAGLPGEDDDEDEQMPYLLEKQGSVGIITINGPITNRDSFWNSVFGIASYGAIREALIYAAEDPEVTDILLDINSGGGAVAGCYDTGNLISLINKSIKPVTAFGDQMYSAAYWLGSSAGEVYAGKTSGVGSIGVIATHMEYSKQLKDEGVNVTVFRSGKYKALVNSVEPLSDLAKSQLQSQLDAAYKIFVEHVAEARNVPYDYADTNMADGKEFFGDQALAAGLVDGITSYDELMQELLNKSIDTSTKSINNRFNNPQGGTMKRALKPEQLMAAVAEGAPVLSAEAQAAVAEAAAALAEPVADPAPATAVDPAPVAAVPDAAPTADAGVVALLQGQIKEANAALLQVNIEMAKLKEQHDMMLASHEGLLAIAKKSVSNMRVALGGTAADLEGSHAASVLAEHRSLSEKFASSFAAGGVAAVDAVDSSNPTKPADVDPRHLARVNAAIGK